MSLAQAISTAPTQNPALQAARAGEQERGAPVDEARAADLPRGDNPIFGRALVVAPASTRPEAAARVAAALTSAFGGVVADALVTGQADLAREPMATQVVVAHPVATGGLPRPAEHWLRRCQLPMLLVPSP